MSNGLAMRIPNVPRQQDNDDDDDIERKRLLEIVSKKGVKVLTRAELERLHNLLEVRDYSSNKKANKSKKKLLSKINAAIYESYNNNNK